MAAVSGAIRAGRAFVQLFADDAELQKGLRRVQAHLKRFGRSVTQAGQTLLRAVAPIGAAVALSMRTFASFDDQMRQTQAVSGATAEQFASLTAEAQRLGRTTSFTASQVAAAMTEMGRAGFAAEEIERSMESVLALARATGTELPRATEIGGAVLRAFGMEAAEMARVADVLTATANSSAQTLENLAEAMKPVAPLARAAGESLEDTAAALAILANNGVKGSMAGNALARALKNLSQEAKQRELADIGVQAADAEGNLRPIVDIINDIARATAQMGSAQRLSIFESLFGRGQAAALILAENIEAFDGVADRIRQSGDEAVKTAEAMDAGVGGAFRRMLSAVEGAGIALGAAVEGPISEWTSSLTEIAGKTTEWIEKNEELIQTVLKVAGVVAAAGAALIAIGTGAKATAFIIGGLIVAVKALGVALTFLMAHPVIAAMVAAVAVGTALNAVLRRMRNNSRELSRAEDERLERNEKIRQNDRDRMNRLEELARAESRNADEMDEASQIIDTLTDRYGELGLSINEATGEIEGMAGAQERLNNIMRQQAVDDLQAVVDSARRNIDRLKEEFEAASEGIGGFFRRLGGDRPGDIAAEIQKEIDRLMQAERQLRATLRGEELAEEARPVTGLGSLGDIDRAGQAIERWQHRLNELRIRLTKEGLEQEIALINERYDRELKRAEENAELIAKIEKARAKEIELIRRQAAEREAEEARRRQEAIDRADERRTETVEELRIRASGKDEADIQRELLELRRRRAIEEAKQNEENLDLVREQFDLERQLLEQRLAAADTIDRARRGAFASLGGSMDIARTQISRVVGTLRSEDDAEKRIARNTADIAGFTEKTASEVKRLVDLTLSGNSGVIVQP